MGTKFAALTTKHSKSIAASIYFSILDLICGIGRKRCTREDVGYTKGAFYENAASQQNADGFYSPGCPGNILISGNWFWRERDSVPGLKSTGGR